jgi:hypothetical protein
MTTGLSKIKQDFDASQTLNELQNSGKLRRIPTKQPIEMTKKEYTDQIKKTMLKEIANKRYQLMDRYIYLGKKKITGVNEDLKKNELVNMIKRTSSVIERINKI